MGKNYYNGGGSKISIYDEKKSLKNKIYIAKLSRRNHGI